MSRLISVSLVIFLLSLHAHGLEKELKWKGLSIKLTEKVSDSLSGGGSCKVVVSKGQKVINEYEFVRFSSVGGGADICSYSLPKQDRQYWFASFNGDYNFPYLAIDASGKKYEFPYLPALYKLEGNPFLFGVHSSEIDEIAELSFFDIKRKGPFYKFNDLTLKKYFNPSTYRHEVYQSGDLIYFKVIKNNKVFKINIKSKNIDLVKNIPKNATKAKIYLPDFHKIK